MLHKFITFEYSKPSSKFSNELKSSYWTQGHPMVPFFLQLLCREPILASFVLIRAHGFQSVVIWVTNLQQELLVSIVLREIHGYLTVPIVHYRLQQQTMGHQPTDLKLSTRNQTLLHVTITEDSVDLECLRQLEGPWGVPVVSIVLWQLYQGPTVTPQFHRDPRPNIETLKNFGEH